MIRELISISFLNCMIFFIILGFAFFLGDIKRIKCENEKKNKIFAWINKTKDSISKIWEKLKVVLNECQKIVAEKFEAFKQLLATWKEHVKSILKKTWENILDLINKIFTWVKEMWNELKSKLTTFWEWLTTILKEWRKTIDEKIRYLIKCLS